MKVHCSLNITNYYRLKKSIVFADVLFSNLLHPTEQYTEYIIQFSSALISYRLFLDHKMVKHTMCTGL